MSERARRPGSVAMRTAAVLSVLYVLNVLAGVLAQKAKLALPFRFGDRGEALVFLVATIAFVVALLQRERLTGAAAGAPARSWWQALDGNAERSAMLVFYVFVCAVIVQEVVRRFVLNYSSAWAEESARYAFIYLGYIGAAYAVRERAHIRFDILLQRMPPRLHGFVYIFSELATIVFAAFALYWSLKTIGQLIRFEGESPVLRFNKAWFVAALPIGFALIVLRSLQAMHRDIADLRAGHPVFTGKAMFEE
jgi:TRAP-type C4-dicarboxylate transport system permease small subunit